MQFEQKETDSHASVATLAQNDGSGLNSYSAALTHKQVLSIHINYDIIIQ